MAREPENPPDLSEPLPIIDGLRALADDYDGFIVDLWGTVHNGVEPLPGAVDCLEHLTATGKPVLILSNAPRRAGNNRCFAVQSYLHVSPLLHKDDTGLK